MDSPKNVNGQTSADVSNSQLCYIEGEGRHRKSQRQLEQSQGLIQVQHIIQCSKNKDCQPVGLYDPGNVAIYSPLGNLSPGPFTFN